MRQKAGAFIKLQVFRFSLARALRGVRRLPFMPIYSYKCSHCGHAKDVLQKLSDAPLRVCPACGQATMQKQVTAAGFQLKGSGWYATDFRGGSNKAAGSKKDKEEAPACAASCPAADACAAASAAG